METIPLGLDSGGKPISLEYPKAGKRIMGEVTNGIAKIYLTLPTERNRFAFLREFYVYAPSEKGLGKRMFCAVLTKYSKELEGCDIKLQASGGTCPEKHQDTKSEAEVDAYLAKYPTLLDEMKTDANRGLPKGSAPVALTYEVKAKKVCEIEDNHKLMKYYTDTYGFQVVEDHGDYADMSAPAATVLAKCSATPATGGAKKKTRRAKRNKDKTRRKSFRAFK